MLLTAIALSQLHTSSHLSRATSGVLLLPHLLPCGPETPGTWIAPFSFLVGQIVCDIEKLVGKRLILMGSCSRMWTSVLQFLSVVAEFALGFNGSFVNPGTSLAERLCGGRPVASVTSLQTFSTLGWKQFSVLSQRGKNRYYKNKHLNGNCSRFYLKIYKIYKFIKFRLFKEHFFLMLCFSFEAYMKWFY